MGWVTMSERDLQRIEVSRSQRRNAALVAHYAIGAVAGGVYGLAAEILPAVRRGYGTGYSNLLFLGGKRAPPLAPNWRSAEIRTHGPRQRPLRAPRLRRHARSHPPLPPLVPLA